MSGPPARPAGPPPRGPAEDAADPPGGSGWPTAYAVVLGLLAVWIGLLAWLTVAYA